MKTLRTSTAVAVLLAAVAGCSTSTLPADDAGGPAPLKSYAPADRVAMPEMAMAGSA
ncbi:hypothetical protein ACIBRY_25975 [Streptomyces anulatus]